MRAIDEGLEWLNEVKYIKTQDKDGRNPIKHEIKKNTDGQRRDITIDKQSKKYGHNIVDDDNEGKLYCLRVVLNAIHGFKREIEYVLNLERYIIKREYFVK